MTPAYIADFKTPRGFNLTGFWFGPTSPKRVVILVHGLSGSALGGVEKALAKNLTDSEMAVFTFNNRGHGIVSSVYCDAKNKKGYTSISGGAAHEVFTDCVDDIDGAVNFVKNQGVKEVYLCGHSTGCQKSVYWAHKKQGGKGVAGIILLAPISDYSAAATFDDKKKFVAVQRMAQRFVESGKRHALLPSAIWPEVLDAQRFLSLYTEDAKENIFLYASPKKSPRILRSVKIPVLVLLAENDEYENRRAQEIGVWFEKNLTTRHEIQIIPRVSHSFKTGEVTVADAMRAFLK